MRLSLGRGKTPRCRTGLSINSLQWSSAKGLPKQTSASNKNLLIDLQALETNILKEVNKANSIGIEIDKEWLETKINIYFNRESESKLSDKIVDVIEDIIDDAPNRINSKKKLGLSKSRKSSYKVLKRSIDLFNSKAKIKEVDVVFGRKYVIFVKEVLFYDESTALKQLSDLKTVCYEAGTLGIETNPQLSDIKVASPKDEEIITLNKEELKIISETELNNERLDNVRKWLLLGCNIGQRVSDLLEIDESNIKTFRSFKVIELVQKKTNKKITIPLLEETKKIIENGFPRKISAVKFNKYLKELCKQCGIDKPTKGKKTVVKYLSEKEKKKSGIKSDKITRKKSGIFPKYELISSHVCRRSFATNLYGELPTPLIMSITGHSTEKQFHEYIGKSSYDYAKQILEFYELQELKSQSKPHLKIVDSKLSS
jgi:integrase